MPINPLNPLDAPGTPFDLELLNPNPTGRRTADGPIYRVSFQIDKEAYDCFMASRSGNLRLLARMVVLPDTDEEEAMTALEAAPLPPKKQKGEHGQFWNHLRRANIHAIPALRQWLQVVAPEDAWRKLHETFGVESLACVSPETAIGIFDDHQQHAASQLCRQVAARLSTAAAPIAA